MAAFLRAHMVDGAGFWFSDDLLLVAAMTVFGVLYLMAVASAITAVLSSPGLKASGRLFSTIMLVWMVSGTVLAVGAIA